MRGALGVKAIAAMLILGVAEFACAQFSIQEMFESNVITNRMQETMPVRVWRNYKPSDCPVPVLVLLHGSGECGQDNTKHLPAFAPIHRQALIDDDLPPALYVVPQCTQRNAWVRSIAFQADYRMPRYPSPALRTVKEYLDQLVEEGIADPNRLYIAGLSLGGFGVWDAIQRWPNTFAAAVPICAGGSLQEEAIQNAKTTAIWVFHGDKDVNVPVACSQRMVAALTTAGAEPKYTEYKNLGHNVWTRAFSDTALLKWVFRQRRGKKESSQKGFWGRLKAYVTPQ